MFNLWTAVMIRFFFVNLESPTDRVGLLVGFGVELFRAAGFVKENKRNGDEKSFFLTQSNV